MNRNKVVFSILFSIALFSLFVFFKNSESADQEYTKHLSKNYQVYSLALPNELDFCKENVPLSENDTKEKIDRELLANTYWHSNTILSIKRANKWFPIIEKVLKKNNVPDDFKYLVVIESGLSNVTSPAGARGYLQFREDPAQEFGLTVNENIDERYHVEKATEAACKYLRKAYEKFDHNWTLAAASYNMGITGLDKRLKEQEVNSYYDLLLNEETSRYIYRIVAIKEIFENQEKYGFHIRDKDLYTFPQYKTVLVDTTIKDLVKFAKSQGITYKSLKQLNPWMRQTHLENEERTTFQIKILERS